MVRAAAAGVGNAVVLMGASTGRDGIGGASVLASAELGEGDEAKRPTVQIGDPFEESKLLECCLELLEKGLLVSLQDLGAAGLTSSAGEMASAGGVGIDIDVARVPLREADMEPFEIMVSESQERMLGVVEPARVDGGARALREMADRRRRDRRRHRQRPGPHPARRRGRRRDAGRRPGRRLPALRPRARPSRRAGSTATARPSTAAPRAEQTLLALLASPSIASKRWAFEQYDSVVGSRTVRRPESADAAVLADPRGRQRDRGLDRRQRPARRLRPLRGHGRGGARVRPEPRLRRRRAARPDQLPQLRQPREAGPRLAARPRGQRPRRRLRGARRPGRRRQRLALQRGPRRPDLPDPGGRHGRRAARPRPGRGHAPSPPRATRSACSAPSNRPWPARSWRSCAASSTPGCRSPRSRPSPPPARRVREAVRAGRLSSAHDVSDGGLACALAESAIGGGIGCRVDLQPLRERGCSPEEALFGEGAGGFLLSGERAALEATRGDGRWARSAARTIEIAAGDRSLGVGLDAIEDAWPSLGERLS